MQCGVLLHVMFQRQGYLQPLNIGKLILEDSERGVEYGLEHLGSMLIFSAFQKKETILNYTSTKLISNDGYQN